MKAALRVHARSRRSPMCSAFSTFIAARAISPSAVEPKIIELEQDRVNLVFEITEGATRPRSRAVNFVGNKAFSDGQLRDIISTTQSGWFDFLKGTSIYDPDRMNARSRIGASVLFEERLRRCDALRPATPSSIPMATGFIITFAVDEGELYNVRQRLAIESSLAEVSARRAHNGELLTLCGRCLQRLVGRQDR